MKEMLTSCGLERKQNRVLGELSRCGNQFVADLKNYLK